MEPLSGRLTIERRPRLLRIADDALAAHERRITARLMTGAQQHVWRPPPLHPKQWELLQALMRPDIRYVDACCGTKFGKTVLAAVWQASEAWQCRGVPGIHRWIAPIYKQAKIGWRTMRALVGAHGVTFKESSSSDPARAIFPSGDIVHFLSADDPDSLAGEAAKSLVCDEAARMKAEAWGIARTNLTATRGKALRICTAKGRNWWWREWLKGQDQKANPHQRSFRCPTWENPHIDPQEIELARADIPDMLFRQEYGAEFVDDADLVFPGYREVLSEALAKRGKQKGDTWQLVNAAGKPEIEASRDYVAGVDLGKVKSFTVVTCFHRPTKTLVYFDRFRGRSWGDTAARITRGLHPYRAQVLIDSTGVGDPVVDDIMRESRDIAKGLPGRVRGFKFTSTSKQQIIENLMVEIEREEITLPDLAPIRTEMQSFEYQYDHNTRRVKYAAPSGMTDDVIDSMALAVWKAKRKRLIPSMEGVY